MPVDRGLCEAGVTSLPLPLHENAALRAAQTTAAPAGRPAPAPGGWQSQTPGMLEEQRTGTHSRWSACGGRPVCEADYGSGTATPRRPSA